MSDITKFPDLGARLSQKIIGSAIEVHKHMGPGLLESIYEECLAIHEAQLLSYMRLSGLELGLIMNFNTVLLKNGIKRMALSQK